MTDSPSNEPNIRPRWWPALVICAGLIVAIFFTDQDGNIGKTGGDDHQSQALKTISSLVIAFVLLLAWALFFARLSKRTRLIILGCLSGSIAVFFGCFQFSQFSGNVVPIFEWRWADYKLPTITDQTNAKSSDQPKTRPLVSLSFPQFLGPTRNCKIPGQELATDWALAPPMELWRQPIGAAWSGFTIVGHRAVTQEQRGENEAAVCYELETGNVLWITQNTGHYNTAIAGEGPRATPTIHESKVYTLGSTGTLNCIELTTGKVIWQRNIATDAEHSPQETLDQIGHSENRNKAKEWGYSSSPLVTDNKVIVSAGGKDGKSLFAYNTLTGEIIWSGGNSRAGYSSAILVNLNDKKQILIFNQDGLAAHSPLNGEVLLSFQWISSAAHVSVPLLLPENRVLLSMGYSNGSKLIQVSETEGNYSAKVLWHSRRMKAKFTNLIFHNNHVFGLDDGIFSCIDIEKGRRKWKDGRYGHGQILLRNNHILVMAENGEVVMIEANPEKHSELTRFSALDGKTWNPPALAGEYLLVRNHREAACYKLPLATSQTVDVQ